MFGFFEKKQPVAHPVTAHDLLQTIGQELYDEIHVLEVMQGPSYGINKKKQRQQCINRMRDLLKSAGIFDHYQLTKKHELSVLQ